MRASSLVGQALLLAATLVITQGCTLGSGDGNNVGGGGGIGGAGFGGTGFSGSGGFFMDGGGAAVGGFFDSGVFPACLSPCPPPPASPVAPFLSSCCTPDNRCGFSTGDALFNGCVAPTTGARDLACPDSDSPILGGLGNGSGLLGCCLPHGMCGVSLDAIGLGCVERRQVGEGMFVQLDGPLDIACGQPEIDGGADDAGDPVCAWALSSGVCDPRASCERVGGTALCTCPEGYADLSPSNQPGKVCRDVDECLLGPGVCDAGQCINTAGGFVCE